jgi:hypothetical protein
MHNSLAGEYFGNYFGAGHSKVQLRVRIATAGVRPEFNNARNVRESEVLAEIDALALDVEIEETVPPLTQKIVSCIAPGVKPDFARGLIRVQCASPANRVYVLGMDHMTDDFAVMDVASEQNTRSGTAARDLVQNKIAEINAISVKILSSEINFHGKCWRGPESAK